MIPLAAQPTWAELTDTQRDHYRGNLDPWIGPVDPEAHARAVRRSRAATRPEPQDACGCWVNDCAECGPRRADGQRPRHGHVRLYALRQDALYLQAVERHALRAAASR